MSLQRIKERVEELTNKINAEKEYLCAAFIKETGAKPSECVICQQVTSNGTIRIWVEKKPHRDYITMRAEHMERVEE